MSPRPFTEEWAGFRADESRESTARVRARMVQLKDEPCCKCGAPAGDFRVLEAVEAAMRSCRPSEPAICEACFRGRP